MIDISSFLYKLVIFIIGFFTHVFSATSANVILTIDFILLKVKNYIISKTESGMFSYKQFIMRNIHLKF